MMHTGPSMQAAARRRFRRWRACALLLAVATGVAQAAAAPMSIPALQPDDLSARRWIDALPDPHRVLLDPGRIQAQNARMRALDPSIHDLAALPDPLPAGWVRERVAAGSVVPGGPLYDARGRPWTARARRALQQALALDAITAARPLRHGLVVRRADLRRVPTAAPAHTDRHDRDIDRFQESALFPGDAVAVLHHSRDRQWLFVASERYLGWIAADSVALGRREAVLGYARRAPGLVVTGASVHTAVAPGEPRVSRLALDMGVRLPLRSDWPALAPVHGQSPLGSYVVDLPARDRHGGLELVPTLVQRAADVAHGALPLTAANLLGQAFKFLGERYGWGHANGTRDCSGFVSEVYRSVGVLLPRNTGDQAASPALHRTAFTAADGHAARMAAVRSLRPGDLVYIPGHVMMVVGHRDGMAFVIHDIHDGRWRQAGGGAAGARLNGVVVTPLEPMLAGDGRSYVEHMTAIVRVAAP